MQRTVLSITQRAKRGVALWAMVALAATVLPMAGAGAQTPTCKGKTATIVLDPDILGYDPFVYGTEGDDVIVGTSGRDYIDGRGGNDLICGRGGADTIRGGPGNDRIYGNTGDDVLDGGRGRDRLIGGRGDDLVQGSTGRDRLRGGPGDDIVVGGVGYDRIIGGSGTDSCDRDGSERPKRCASIVTLRYQTVRVSNEFETDGQNDYGDEILGLLGSDLASVLTWSHTDAPELSGAIVATSNPADSLSTRIKAPTSNSHFSSLGTTPIGNFDGESQSYPRTPRKVTINTACCWLY